MITKKKSLALFLGTICWLNSVEPMYLVPDERIRLFDCDITVQTDGTIDVIERITVRARGEQIKHGLLREFPTSYKDRLGNRYVVGFSVKQVLMDGRPAPYTIKSYANGKRIYIGNPDQWLPSGVYTFSIHYTTNRQLGFFDYHDELYWNITGSGWVFVIEHVTARVKLPASIPVDKITYEAYTGYLDEKGTSYQSSIGQDGVIKFETTGPLKPHQGITCVVTWPKGVIHQPSFLHNAFYFFQDNFSILLLMLILLLFGLFCLYVYIKKCRIHGPSTIIPLFQAPQGISAGDVYYLKNFAYSHQALTAEIVDMARAGYFSIESEYKFLSTSYSLRNALNHTERPAETINQSMHDSLHHLLFGSSPVKDNVIDLSSKNRTLLQAVNAYLKNYLEQKFNNTHLKFFHTELLFASICAAIAAIHPFHMLIRDGSPQLTIPFSAGFLGITLLASCFLKTYTAEGKKLVDQIDGFKMFLETTEIERMKIIGTPPTKTPELYEKYLPYAIALGVEQAWTTQFAPVFARMEQQGHAYHPMWYHSTVRTKFDPMTFSQNIGRSFNSAIASSAKVPGSSSGFGGRGSSGRGGGGGGGGGW